MDVQCWITVGREYSVDAAKTQVLVLAKKRLKVYWGTNE